MNRYSWTAITFAFALVIAIAFSLGRSSAGLAPTIQAQPNDGQRAVGQTKEIDASPSPKALTAATSELVCSKPFAKFDSPTALLALESDFEQTAGLYTLAGRADLATLERFLEDAQSIANQSDRNASIQVIFQRLLELAPDLAIARAESFTGQFGQQLLFATFSNLARSDLDKAIENAKSMSPSRLEWLQNAIMIPYQDNPETVRYIVEQMNLSGQASNPYRSDPILVARATTDPEGAFKAAFEISNAVTRQQTMVSIGHIWASADPAQALAAIDSLPAGQLRTQFRITVLGIIAQSDPEQVLSILIEQPTISDDWAILAQAMPALAASDPQRALQLAKQLPTSNIRAQALGIVLANWAKSDLAATLATIESLPSLTTTERATIASSISQNLTNSDPTTALALVERIEGRKGNAWIQLVSVIAQTDANKAIELVAALADAPGKIAAMTQIISTLAYADPTAAITHIDRLPPGQHRSNALQQIAVQLANHDAVAAVDWALSLSAHDRAQALQSLGYQLAQADFTLALAYTDQIQNPVTQGHWISSLVSAGQQEATYLFDWLEDYSDRPQYGQWLAQLIGNSATNADGIETSLDLLAKISDDEQYRLAAQQLGTNWAQHDPRAAARWFNLQSSTERNEDTLRAIVDAWRIYEPRAAERWVLNLRATDERDAGLVALIGYDGALDWRHNWALIGKISHAEIRDSTYANQIRQMANYDLTTARQMLRGSNVSNEQRAFLDQYLAELESGSG